MSELLSESDHIHNKAIFDAVNEGLNSVRPYGRLGEPMPWSNRARKNFFPYADEKDLERILDVVKTTVLSWADIKAGQVSSNVIIKSNAPKASDDDAADDDKVGDKEKKESDDDSGFKSEAGVIKQAAFK